MASMLVAGKALGKQAQTIIMNVYKYFSDQQKSVEKTQAATGASLSSIWRIRRNGISSPKKPGPKTQRVQEAVDEFDRGAIRRLIQGMYADKKWPTLANIHERVREEMGFQGSCTTLARILSSMGFQYKTRKSASRNLLKEKPDIVAKRQEFILKVRDLRLTGRPFVYLDETWLNSGHTVGRCWLDADGNGGISGVPIGKGSRLIILHAGTAEGWVPGALLCFQSKHGKEDYHEEMDGPTFFKWIEEQLLPNIPAESVIIIDNAPYHSMVIDRAPTLASKKADLQKWLTEHNISFDPKMIKVQLYELVKLNKRRFPLYVIDELAARHGHTIVRTPPYHCEFNAEELIWAQIKGGVARRNSRFTLKHVKTLLEEEISKVTPENWRKAIEHVQKLEDAVFSDELKIDSRLNAHELSTLRFCPFDSDSDSSDDDDECSISDWASDDSADNDLLWIPQQEEVYSSSGDDMMPEYPAWTGTAAEL